MAWIVPSLLAANFGALERDIRRVEDAGAKALHLDVMDGHFVPNVSFGVPILESVRKLTDLVLDVHLMVSNAENSFQWYIDAGADYLSFHYEAVSHLDRLVTAVAEQGVQPGVVLNPHSPIGVLEEILPKCHHVLLMSVNPGFGGQRFIRASLEKTRKLRRMIRSVQADVRIEMDGGLGPDNTREVVEAGVDLLVTGSSIFGSGDPGGTLREMQAVADSVGIG